MSNEKENKNREDAQAIEHQHDHEHHHNEEKDCCGECAGNGACRSLQDKPTQHFQQFEGFNRILVPFDFSECGEKALHIAAKLAPTNAAVTLINVWDFPYVYDPTGMLSIPVSPEEISNNQKEALDKLVNSFKEMYPSLSFNCIMITNENPSEAISQQQEKGHHDIIIMGSHGRKGIDRLLLGSVAEEVLRKAKCPVMIIKK